MRDINHRGEGRRRGRRSGAIRARLSAGRSTPLVTVATIAAAMTVAAATSAFTTLARRPRVVGCARYARLGRFDRGDDALGGAFGADRRLLARLARLARRAFTLRLTVAWLTRRAFALRLALA